MTTVQNDIRIVVRVESIRWFTQWNRWTRQRETKACVKMVPSDGGHALVTFTNSTFVERVNEGDVIALEAKFKNDSDYNGEQQIVVTHCKMAKRISKG